MGVMCPVRCPPKYVVYEWGLTDGPRDALYFSFRPRLSMFEMRSSRCGFFNSAVIVQFCSRHEKDTHHQKKNCFIPFCTVFSAAVGQNLVAILFTLKFWRFRALFKQFFH